MYSVDLNKEKPAAALLLCLWVVFYQHTRFSRTIVNDGAQRHHNFSHFTILDHFSSFIRLVRV
jgi:hypothetical protein